MTIEERLKQADNSGRNSSLLWAQWRFDKDLLTRSLNTIATLFPHYSLHESSHSRTILSEIEKIIGNKIESLSFVDCWLMLEAAYWHDVGMILPDEEKLQVTASSEFIDFVRDKADNTDDLNEFARIYVDCIDGKGSQSPLEISRALMFLLADYVRIVHPSRSSQALLLPENYGIATPRTGLINRRLFSILGDIVKAHGEDFSFILSLPFENDGLDVNDYAHPRMIAAMLRIGDLLDLDDGRHCQTLLRSIGKKPSLSTAHHQKHMGIISKTVNQSYIEINSRCSSFEAFELQNDWFAFLESEIQNQDKNWSDIVPQHYINKLPTLRGLISEHEGSISFEKTPTRLQMDTQRVYSYLTGQAMYENPFACIPELLQNAVDATIDRIWVEKKEDLTDRTKFRQFANQFPIHVTIETTDVEPEKVEYSISIKDQGKGMDLDDIKSMLMIASKSAQERKKAKRQAMPEWMRPSGFFGIGLQSVFSVSPELTITTMPPGKSQYEILLRSTKDRTPSYTVKAKNIDDWRFGTTVSIKFTTTRIPQTLRGGKEVRDTISNFDPLKDRLLDAKGAQIVKQINQFALHSDIPIYRNRQSCQTNEITPFEITDLQNGLEYNIDFTIGTGSGKLLYRGRPVDDFTYSPEMYHVTCNIIAGVANEYLQFNREKFHREGMKLFHSKLQRSLTSNKAKLISEKGPMASLFFLIKDQWNDLGWHDIMLSGHRLVDLVQPKRSLGLCFHRELLDNPGEGTWLIDEEAHLLVATINGLKQGVIIQAVRSLPVKKTPYRTRDSVPVFMVEVTAARKDSTIEPNVIQHFSHEGLRNAYIRNWLPYGRGKYEKITLPYEAKPPWINHLSHFHPLFDSGIILRSTQELLEQDIPVLQKYIASIRSDVTGIEIDRLLREFYEEFPFETPQAN